MRDETSQSEQIHETWKDPNYLMSIMEKANLEGLDEVLIRYDS